MERPSSQAGTVLGSDQRQLFQAGGFKFPFTEDLLIPRASLFGLPPFAAIPDVSIGRTDTHVVIRVGLWTFFFFIDKQGRFPDVGSIIPRPSQAATRLRLDADDVQKFLDSLTRRLKGPNANELALTLDLMGTPCFRFEIEGRVSEVRLANSEFSGKPLRMCLNLQQFLGALELRFLDFEIRDADKPILARDGERLYLSMPLPASGALLPRSEKIPSEASKPSTALAPVEQPSTPTIVVPMGSMPVRPAGDHYRHFGAPGFRRKIRGATAHNRVIAKDEESADDKLSLENNGGFASVRTKAKKLGLEKGDSVVAKIRGDGREYTLNLYVNKPLIAFSYRATVQTKIDECIEVKVPLDKFEATSFGRVVKDAGPVDPKEINALGFMLSDKKAGRFKMEIESIKVERAK